MILNYIGWPYKDMYNLYDAKGSQVVEQGTILFPSHNQKEKPTFCP